MLGCKGCAGRQSEALGGEIPDIVLCISSMGYVVRLLSRDR